MRLLFVWLTFTTPTRCQLMIRLVLHDNRCTLARRHVLHSHVHSTHRPSCNHDRNALSQCGEWLWNGCDASPTKPDEHSHTRRDSAQHDRRTHTSHTHRHARKLTKYVDTGTQAHNKTGHGTHAPRAEARDALSCQVRNRAVVCCSLLDWICLSCGNRKSFISNLCCCAAIPACKIV